ncbi:2,3-diketo-5-methylthiopentyl-1-phosphate enolase [Paenibacillus baekrokdamisoli]|uniref:2,3-diketo-5-methylthiopentyl-1-phosphate enolase n=1 Tax=Paenibacillus baekrokdamisoli TaxID=1712516 RepID=A0A3G9J8S2_9BACL|nr:2,3-diketo-5-methylthiopentyl-1-phosphate enolase [Paenibacillus baekrokdamisoli]MBB3067144.1 2,3-diketo-5-methylthiopentyl-1-phosphate enolase [Paenibacillus baekrokdamisoli]BBH19664.1 2,3-diketo-5-methylthiopentyl-1-phosphate enolase [Paenibacillus baekrokdamisoli]
MSHSVCIATYRCHDDKADFNKKAQGIAVGLTVGSWTDLPEARKAEMEKHLGRVLSVTVYEPENAAPGERYADLVIAYPDVNFSRDLPALLVTVFGKLSMDGRIKLLDLDFSPAFVSAFPGPKFGITGVRELLGIEQRPLLMSIFKSVIGHDLPNLREQFYRQALGGVDLIKDDEILFENPLTPLEKRVEACMEAAEQAQAETGQKLLYAVNLTGSTSKLAANAKLAIAAGANALLFNVLAYGYDVLHELSSDPEISVPIAAHPALAGAFYPSPHYGIAAPLLLGKLMRLAGADLVLFPSPYGSVVMPKEENLAVQAALIDPALPVKASFPVPSAGIHPGLVPLILRDFGQDVVVNAGGGIHGHPLGTAAGGQAFRQAITATLSGISLPEAASQPGNEALQAAINSWGYKE